MTRHIAVPLPAGVSINQARRIAVECEAAVARVTGTMPDATVTDFVPTDQERRVLARICDVAQETAATLHHEALESEAVADLRARLDPDAVRWPS